MYFLYLEKRKERKRARVRGADHAGEPPQKRTRVDGPPVETVRTVDPPPQVDAFPAGVPRVAEHVHLGIANPNLFRTCAMICKFLGFDNGQGGVRQSKVLIGHQNPAAPETAVLRQYHGTNYQSSVHQIGKWFMVQVELIAGQLAKVTFGPAFDQTRPPPLYGWKSVEVLCDTRILMRGECQFRPYQRSDATREVYKVEVRSNGVGGADFWINQNTGQYIRPLSGIETLIRSFITACGSAGASGPVFTSIVLKYWVATIGTDGMSEDLQDAPVMKRAYSTLQIEGFESERLSEQGTQLSAAAQSQAPRLQICMVMGAGPIDVIRCSAQMDLKQCAGCFRYPGPDPSSHCVCKLYRPNQTKSKLHSIVSVFGEDVSEPAAVTQQIPNGMSVVDLVGSIVRVSMPSRITPIRIHSIATNPSELNQIQECRRPWIAGIDQNHRESSLSQADSDDSARILQPYGPSTPSIVCGLPEANFVYVSLLPKRFPDQKGPVIALTDCFGMEIGTNTDAKKKTSILVNFTCAGERSADLFLIMGEWSGTTILVAFQFKRPADFAVIWRVWMEKFAVAKPE